jgi:hypothetical protein
MTLTPEQRLAIDRARARVAEQSIHIELVLFDELFEFEFKPTMTQPALDIVARVQEMASSSNATVSDQLRAVMDFMDAMATDSTAELIAQLAHDGIMTINDLVNLQMQVVEQVAGRPTTRSSSSAGGSPESGESSTASAPALASTPQR